MPEEKIQKEPALVNPPEPEANVVTAKKEDIRKEITGLTRVTAVKEENIHFEEEGRIQEIYVDYDERVKKGEELARLDVKDLEFEYQLAEIDLEKQRLIKEKEEKFLGETVSERDYEMTKMDYEREKIKYNQLKESLEQYTIYSPIDGKVVSISMQENNTVEEGSEVITIADTSELELMMNVSSTEVEDINPGLKAQIRFSDEYFEAEVTEVNDSSTENTDPYVVIELKDKSEIFQKLDVSEDEILNYGDLLSSTIILEKREDTIIIPSAAVRETNDEPYVRLKKDNNRKDVEIQTGIETDNYIEVKEGIQKGDNIILN